MKQSKATTVFRRFFISYIIILLIPMLSGIISYQVSLQTAEKYSITNSRQVLNQSKAILEQRLTEIDRFGRQLSLNKDLITLLNKNVTERNKIISSMRRFSADISPYASTNEFLEDFYIYIQNTDLVVVPGSVYFRPLHYYQQNHYTDLTFSQWKTEILESDQPYQMIPSKPYVKKESNTKVITYVKSLSMSHNGENNSGSIVVPIEQNKMNHLLNGISKQFGGWSFITDANQNVITAHGIKEDRINHIVSSVSEENSKKYLDDGTLLISLHSDKYDWVYVAGIPNETLTKQAQPIKYITWIVTGSTLIIGLIICLVFAYRNSRPINHLIRTLKDYSELETKNDYDFLHGNVSKLIAANTNLQTQLAEQKPLLKDAFLKQLLSGELTESNSHLYGFAKQVNVDLNGNNGYVSVVKIEGYEEISSSEIYEELHAIQLVIKQESSKICRKFYLTNIHSDKLVYIFIDDQENGAAMANKIEKMFMSLQEYFHKEYRITLKVGIGHEFNALSDISRSYNEAKQAIEFATFSNEGFGLYWYDEMMQVSAVFYYPLEYELRLLKNLKDGEAEEAKKIIRELFIENIDKRCLSTDMVDQFIYEVKGTFFKSFEQYFVRKENLAEYIRKKLLDIQLTSDVHLTEKLFMEVIDYYCKVIRNERQHTNHYTVKSINKFLENHYSNADLNLYAIAEHFGRPEKYISQIFKEETGEYITEYLEKIRINKAMYLLANTQKKIVEISELVGYNSAHSFRRAFKRINNITPNQYRNTMKSG
ncbi:helix-turn-helix domain-containing protein [Gracilibacillus sp. YIM 98692]|uniref:helix-turn-helix domain-containing protein n=1 Tax=Gracilibacillus sp. YIM 98692 TaxID=2663532 RepID=UPI0013D3E8E3|nr:helix-turn-helix domain-containing protein [Gracilibacillus sp. YIM 98692]